VVVAEGVEKMLVLGACERKCMKEEVETGKSNVGNPPLLPLRLRLDCRRVVQSGRSKVDSGLNRMVDLSRLRSRCSGSLRRPYRIVRHEV